MKILSDIQQDAITEIVNIATGRAAASLSEMVGHDIKLDVPNIEFIDAYGIRNIKSDIPLADLTVVRQTFGGDFNGESVLVFPADKTMRMVRLFVGDDTPDEVLSEMEGDALVEIGNVILNAFMGSIGNLLEIEVPTDIPLYLKNNTRDQLLGMGVNPDGRRKIILLVDVNFGIQGENITGYVLLVMDIPSIETFTGLVDDFLKRVT